MKTFKEYAEELKQAEPEAKYFTLDYCKSINGSNVYSITAWKNRPVYNIKYHQWCNTKNNISVITDLVPLDEVSDGSVYADTELPFSTALIRM